MVPIGHQSLGASRLDASRSGANLNESTSYQTFDGLLLELY